MSEENIQNPAGSPPMTPSGAEEVSRQEPPTFTEALRRNPFFADEDGQAMVEMVVVGPVLLFLMVAIFHYHTLLDAQQDFFIQQRNLIFGKIIGINEQTAYGSTHTLSPIRSDDDFGWGNWLPGDIGSVIDIPNVVRFWPAIKVNFMNPWSSGIEHQFNAIVAAFQINRPGRGSFSTITDFGSNAASGEFDDIMNAFGTPYEAMGLPVNNYQHPVTNNAQRVNQRMITNPYRSTLLGLGSFFNGMDGSQSDENRAGWNRDPFPLSVRYVMVTDPWKADFQNGTNQTGNTVEDFIRETSGGVTFFEGPYGFVTALGLLLTSGMLPDFGVNIRNWHHMPWDYKVDGRDAATTVGGKSTMNTVEIPYRPLKPLMGNNLVQSWH